MSRQPFPTELNRALTALPPGAIAIGYSGGADSHALLHALAHDADARARGVRALHIDHGLHAESTHWANHCRDVCAELGMAFDGVRVEVVRDGRTGIEDAARSARMHAFASTLRPGEILALAQHRDDQAETVLLKLLRGAGPQGLGAMRTLRQCGKGTLWRPLLDLPRSMLIEYAQTHGLEWIDDPSNANLHLRRNFLRSEILPRLRERWPDAETALAHSARWARAAHDFIDTEARKALARLQGLDPATLIWRGWLDLPDALRDPVLRLWLRDLHLDMPTHFHVDELERQLRDAAVDRLPCIAFADTELRRYRDLLYALRPQPAPPCEWQIEWTGEALTLPGGGTLELIPTRAFDPPLHVRYRRGGEHFKPANATHTRELRVLLQEHGAPPWQRAHLPIVWRGADLLAVADLFISDAGVAFFDQLGTRLLFTPHLRAMSRAYPTGFGSCD